MAEKRSNQKQFVSLGTVLDSILQQHRRPNDREMLKVWELWEQSVGPAIAANARPAAFKGGLLLVHVASSTWLHHLRYLEQDIIDRLNAAMGDRRISHIKLKVGTL